MKDLVFEVSWCFCPSTSGQSSQGASRVSGLNQLNQTPTQTLLTSAPNTLVQTTRYIIASQRVGIDQQILFLKLNIIVSKAHFKKSDIKIISGLSAYPRSFIPFHPGNYHFAFWKSLSVQTLYHVYIANLILEQKKRVFTRLGLQCQTPALISVLWLTSFY